MKTSVLIATLLLTTSVFAQTGLVTEFNEACNCNIVTNHYDEGQVSSVHHETPGGKKHGKETVFYNNGQMQYERTWKNGKLDGEGKHYHQNGNLHYTEAYKDGQKSGSWSFYEEDGTILQTIIYNGANATDGTYEFYHAGIKYLSQDVENGRMTNQNVINQKIYDQLKAEAEALRQAGKQP